MKCPARWFRIQRHRQNDVARVLASVCALVLAPLAAPAGSGDSQTARWLLENYPRDAAPAYPAMIAISGCKVTVTRRPDRKTDVTTVVDLRHAVVSFYTGPGVPHVDFLTAGIFPMRLRFADGTSSASGTAAAGLVTRRGDQARAVASAFDRLRASCARPLR
jgi:hypothetical protein